MLVQTHSPMPESRALQLHNVSIPRKMSSLVSPHNLSAAVSINGVSMNALELRITAHAHVSASKSPVFNVPQAGCAPIATLVKV
jgi:hypothetical protein